LKPRTRAGSDGDWQPGVRSMKFNRLEANVETGGNNVVQGTFTGGIGAVGRGTK
jgi:hypothetical protein